MFKLKETKELREKLIREIEIDYLPFPTARA